MPAGCQGAAVSLSAACTQVVAASWPAVLFHWAGAKPSKQEWPNAPPVFCCRLPVRAPVLQVLGMHALRHEEFKEGCKAACNGPYDGMWSKTMIGYDNEVRWAGGI